MSVRHIVAVVLLCAVVLLQAPETTAGSGIVSTCIKILRNYVGKPMSKGALTATGEIITEHFAGRKAEGGQVRISELGEGGGRWPSRVGSRIPSYRLDPSPKHSLRLSNTPPTSSPAASPRQFHSAPRRDSDVPLGEGKDLAGQTGLAAAGWPRELSLLPRYRRTPG